MTVTTPVRELLQIARRYEAETRWAQATAAYQEALDNMQNANSLDSAQDRKMIEDMRQACINRSHEMVSNTLTSVTEAAKAEIDRLGAELAEVRAKQTGSAVPPE